MCCAITGDMLLCLQTPLATHLSPQFVSTLLIEAWNGYHRRELTKQSAAAHADEVEALQTVLRAL
jgi:hypothetical protein